MVPEEKAKLALFIFSTEDPIGRLARSIAEELLEYSERIRRRDERIRRLDNALFTAESYDTLRRILREPIE